ncbi:MAG: hypothetical protein HZC38_12740 [Chloroflexi bacterium]|nr:hypothetical protein [Chloroflexota bacterium]
MTHAIINLAPPNHIYKTASQMPESQLQMIVPRVLWRRTRAYIPHFEAVHLAGRFGADPGDYEWELLDQPHGLKWWRRTNMGDAAYCAAILVPDPNLDPVEAFGIIDIASDTPWWFDAVINEGLIQGRGEAFARERKISIDAGRVLASIEEEYQPRELLTATPDQDGVAWRCGDLAEVTLLKEAIVGLINRANKATLPAETR